MDVAQGIRREHGLAGLHPRAVAADGVYLAIVGQEAERLCERPRGERVGGETAVDQGQATREITVGEVRVVLPELEAGQHALVHDVLA